jgi:hypothetical protein
MARGLPSRTGVVHEKAKGIDHRLGVEGDLLGSALASADGENFTLWSKAALKSDTTTSRR